MQPTKIIFEDEEKIVHEVLGDQQAVPEWILFGGDQVGKCMLKQDATGNYTKTNMYHGLQLDQVENKIFIIKVKHPIRPNEAYGISFEGTKTNILSCYNEGQWEISLSQTLGRYPNLNQIPELKAYGKKYAIPGLIFNTATVKDQFETYKQSATLTLLAQLQDPQVLGFLERESIFQWHVGMLDYNDLKSWISIRLLWDKIKENLPSLSNSLVQAQDAESFAHNIESSRMVLTQVIKPLCVAHNITRLAEKHNIAYNLQAQQQWMSIELSKLVRKSFVKAFENE
jgi:hypothetical protein